jgi:hypothetical protein
MVQIKQESAIDAKKYPQTAQWDVLRRENHNGYEEKVNECLYQLQKLEGMRWPYSVFYPQYSQHNFLELQIYENLQSLGKYTQEEVALYKERNSQIEGDLSQVFSTRIPLEGLALGTMLQVFPIKYKLSLANNVALLVAPMLLQWGYRKFNITYKHNVNRFLDWTLERRKGQAELELLQDEINQEEAQKFRTTFNNGSALKLFKAYLSL